MRNGSKIGLAIMILTVYLLTGCDVIGRDSSSSYAGVLESKTWVLISFGTEGQLQTVIEGVEITATFNPDEAEVNGSSGCNHYFGEYKVSGNEISVFNMAWTEIGCVTPEGVMELEQEFLAMLATAKSFEVQEDKLIIFATNGQLLNFE